MNRTDFGLGAAVGCAIGIVITALTIYRWQITPAVKPRRRP